MNGPMTLLNQVLNNQQGYKVETSGRQIQAGYSGQWIAAAPAAEQKQILAENPQIQAE
jgi:hypothetical protein